MGRITIYIPEKNITIFTTLRLEIKDLWYKKYGEVLSLGSMIIKALMYLKDSLENKTDDNKRQIIHKYLRNRS